MSYARKGNKGCDWRINEGKREPSRQQRNDESANISIDALSRLLLEA